MHRWQKTHNTLQTEKNAHKVKTLLLSRQAHYLYLIQLLILEQFRFWAK